MYTFLPWHFAKRRNFDLALASIAFVGPRSELINVQPGGVTGSPECHLIYTIFNFNIRFERLCDEQKAKKLGRSFENRIEGHKVSWAMVSQ